MATRDACGHGWQGRAVAAALDIAALRPDFMSVTYGAGGGTSDFTVHIAEKIKGVAGVEVMPHLTCIFFWIQLYPLKTPMRSAIR